MIGKEPITRCGQCGAYVYKTRPCTTCNAPEEKYEWIERANCRGLDTDLFFPERGMHNRSVRDQALLRDEIAQALKVCASCPVRAQCLDYGMDDQHGIFGGLLPEQRKQLRNKTRRKGHGR